MPWARGRSSAHLTYCPRAWASCHSFGCREAPQPGPCLGPLHGPSCGLSAGAGTARVPPVPLPAQLLLGAVRAGEGGGGQALGQSLLSLRGRSAVWTAPLLRGACNRPPRATELLGILGRSPSPLPPKGHDLLYGLFVLFEKSGVNKAQAGSRPSLV